MKSEPFCSQLVLLVWLLSWVNFATSEPRSFESFEEVPGEPLSVEDFRNAESFELARSSPPTADLYDPIEMAGQFEGDIILPPNEGADNDQVENRNAIVLERQKWPGGILYYSISSQFNPIERSTVARAFLEYQRQTCIVFRPRTTESDYINIVKGKGCSSHVGRTGGAQPVSLGEGCVIPGIVIHELMHAVGFWHEQSRWDRDEHIDVFYENVAPGMAFNFRKYTWQDIKNLSVPYDTSSVMHYAPTAFASDKRNPTIKPKIPNSRMGQRDGFSPNDILKINLLYGCTSLETEFTTRAPPSTADNDAAKPYPDSSKSCSDSHTHCPYWSQVGECTKNSAWMQVNCRASCQQCGTHT